MIDYGAARVDWSGSDGNGFGQFLLSPYHTNKDPNQDHPVGYTWYDDVIISTQPIAMSGGRPPTPPKVEKTAPPRTNNTVFRTNRRAGNLSWRRNETAQSPAA